MKYINNLRQKYLKPSAPWWVVVLVMPVLVIMEVEPTRKLQPVFKPVVALGRFVHTAYRDTFPANEAGFILEMMFLFMVGMTLLLTSDW